MPNLTFDENLVREHKAEPLEGHAVVVLERVGDAGEKFHSVLEPGDERPRQSPLLSLFGKPREYLAFAVDMSKGRSLAFAEPVEMSEHGHDFEVQFSLWYRVGDPQALVASRTTDPLGRVRRKVAEVVTEEIAELPWTDVWHSFRAMSDAVVADTAAELKQFARDFGLVITHLRLRAKFDHETDRSIRAVRESGRLARERMEVADTLAKRRIEIRQNRADMEDQDRASTAGRALHATVTGAYTDKAGELLRQATSMAELQEVYTRLGEATGGGLPGAASRAQAPVLHAGPGASPGLMAGGTGLGPVLAEVVAFTQFRPDAQCRQVRSSLLYLLAAAVEDDSAHPSPELVQYAERARMRIESAPLAADRMQALLEIADPRRLHKRLYA